MARALRAGEGKGAEKAGDGDDELHDDTCGLCSHGRKLDPAPNRQPTAHQTARFRRRRAAGSRRVASQTNVCSGLR